MDFANRTKPIEPRRPPGAGSPRATPVPVVFVFSATTRGIHARPPPPPSLRLLKCYPEKWPRKKADRSLASPGPAAAGAADRLRRSGPPPGDILEALAKASNRHCLFSAPQSPGPRSKGRPSGAHGTTVKERSCQSGKARETGRMAVSEWLHPGMNERQSENRALSKP